MGRENFPIIVMLTFGHAWLDNISPLGELINNLFFIKIIGMLYRDMHCVDMKECEALESNNTVTGLELIENIPNTTSRVI
jgi:hypothetical protein